MESHDGLYGFSEKILRLRRTPTAGSSLRVSGKPHLPVLVKLKNQAAIDAMVSAEGGAGVYEYLIVDKNLDTREGARERARAELAQYKETLSEGEFETTKAGLAAGQRIFVNSTSRGIAEYFVINRVVSTMETQSTLRYSVSLVTTKTFDMISVLQKLLLQETKTIEVGEDEVLDVVEAFDETLSFSPETFVSSTSHNPQTETITNTESFTAEPLNRENEWVLGKKAPVHTSPESRTFILGGQFGGSKLSKDL